jgi:heme exporter protein D
MRAAEANISQFLAMGASFFVWRNIAVAAHGNM